MLQIPGYRLLDKVAAGASGTVYRAVQEDLDRVVALKVLAPGLFDAEETRARFLREARLQAKLAHPNLVALYDAGFAGPNPYLVTEFIDGGTLRHRLDRSGSLPVDESVRLGSEIAGAVGCAHLAGIVHRDLKPENVFLASDGSARVGDFGLARSVVSGHTMMTVSGRILGTPGYLPPEVLEGASAGTPADVYALGVILYEMLTGRRPFAAEELADLFTLALRGSFSPAAMLVPGLPPALDALVSRCLSLVPGDRPLTGVDVARELSSTGVAEPHAVAGSSPAATERFRPVARPTVQTALPGRAHASGHARRAETVRLDSSLSSAERPGPELTVVSLFGPKRRVRLWLAAFFGLVAVLVLAALLGRSPVERPPVHPGNDSPLPARTAGPSAPLRPVGFTHAVGIDSLVLHFDEPTPPGLTLELSVFPSQGGSRQSVPPGVRVFSVAGLAPRTPPADYRASLACGSWTTSLAFHTLPVIPGHQMAYLDDGSRQCERVELVARGTNVAAVWSTFAGVTTPSLFLRTSADGGQTWGPTTVLAVGMPFGSARFEVVSAPGGPLVVWNGTARGGDRDPVLAGRSGAREHMLSVLRCPTWCALLPAGPGAWELLALQETATATTLTHGSLTQSPRLWYRDEALLGSGSVPLGLAWLGAGRNDTLSVAMAFRQTTPAALYWTPVRDKAGWRPAAWRRLTAPTETPRHPTLAEGGGGLLLGYGEHVGRSVTFRALRPGAREFSEAIPMFALALVVDFPSLAYSEGEFILALVADPIVLPSLEIRSSRNGVDWPRRSSERVDGWEPRSLRLVLAGDRLVVAGATRSNRIWLRSLPHRAGR